MDKLKQDPVARRCIVCAPATDAGVFQELQPALDNCFGDRHSAVASPEDILQAIESDSEPCVVLLDWDWEELDSPALLERVCQLQNIRTIAIGSQFDAKFVRMLARYGVVYFPKPLEGDALPSLLRKLTASHPATPNLSEREALVRAISGLHLFSQRRVLNRVLRQLEPNCVLSMLESLESAVEAIPSYQTNISSS